MERYWVDAQSPKWFELRKTCDLTASDAGILINQHYQSRRSYLQQYHGMKSREIDDVTKKFMQQGVEHELEFYPKLKKSIETHSKVNVVVNNQFYRAETAAGVIGASPDAVIIHTELDGQVPVEIKFRNTPWLENEPIPAKHAMQIYCQMIVMESQKGVLIQTHKLDGVSFHKITVFSRTETFDADFFKWLREFVYEKRTKVIPTRTSKISIENTLQEGGENAIVEHICYGPDAALGSMMFFVGSLFNRQIKI
jgi:hypothetical protein